MIPPSPTTLTAPSNGRPGVRRLNRVPIIIMLVIMGITGVGVAWTMIRNHRRSEVVAAQEVASTKTHGGKPPAFINANANAAASAGGDLPPAKGPPPVDTPGPGAQPGNNGSGLTLEEQARSQAWQAYWQQHAQLVAAHNQLDLQSRSGSTDPLGGSGGGNAQIPQNGSQPDDQGSANVAGADGSGPYSTGGVNPAGQTGKQAFLRTPGDPYGQNENVPGTVHGPKPQTVMEGTALPAYTIEAATSDSPGQLVAMIARDVFDDMTGDILLIPQNTKIITTYDTAVSVGQTRMGTIAQRLIFPDTSSRQIGSMQVADQSGAAGLHDVLNTHFWEKFGTAMTIAVIGAGTQLAQPQQSAFATPGGTSAATGAFSQQMSQFGINQAQALMNIPNTIELRPGLPILVKMNKDLTLPRYVDHRLGQTSNTASLTIGKFIQ